MNDFVKRQLRTTFLLALTIVLLVAAGMYIRWWNSFEVIATDSGATAQDKADALIAYKRMAAGEGASVAQTAPEGMARRAQIVFTGMTEASAMEDLTRTLLKQGQEAVFFVTTAEAAHYRDSIALLLENGFSIGLMGSGASETLEGTDMEALVEKLCRAVVQVRSLYGVQMQAMLCVEAPADEALRAAAANGLTQVYVADQVLQLAQCASAEELDALIAAYPRGTILRVNIDREERGTAAKTGNLLAALAATDLAAAAAETMAAADPEAELPEPLTHFTTTDRAVAFTFAGLGSSGELTQVLSALDANGGKATFFVDWKEAAGMSGEIRRILDAGHVLGVRPVSDLETDPAQILFELNLARELLLEKLGHTCSMLTRAGSGEPGWALRRAAAAGGYTVVSHTLCPVTDRSARATDVQTVLTAAFAEREGQLQRGEIVHFRMNSLRNGSELLGDMVTAMLTERSAYPLQLAGEMQNSYTLPVTVERMPEGTKELIAAGQLHEDAAAALADRLVGAPWIADAACMPGFTEEELALLNADGVIAGAEGLVFLTFHGWGGDREITAVLDVLEKHGAKAAFFVQTGLAAKNPNLLRAIAEAGHLVAPNGHNGTPLAVLEEGTAAEALGPVKQALLAQELQLSWQYLGSIVGDVTANDLPVMTPYFSAPTCVMSKPGAETVLDVGFRWIFCGVPVAGEDDASLAAGMAEAAQPGTVLAIPLATEGADVAAALDAFLTELAAGEAPCVPASLTDVLK